MAFNILSIPEETRFCIWAVLRILHKDISMTNWQGLLTGRPTKERRRVFPCQDSESTR